MLYCISAGLSFILLTNIPLYWYTVISWSVYLLMDIYTVFTLGAITDKAYDKGSKAIDKVCEHQCPGLRIDICILFPWIKTCKSHAWITWEVYVHLFEKLPYCLQSGGAVSHPQVCVRPPGPPDSCQSAVWAWFLFSQFQQVCTNKLLWFQFAFP